MMATTNSAERYLLDIHKSLQRMNNDGEIVQENEEEDESEGMKEIAPVQHTVDTVIAPGPHGMYKCTICHRLYQNYRTAHQHFKSTHDTTSSESGYLASRAPTYDVSMDESLDCTECKKLFAELIDHTKPDNWKLKCPVCKRVQIDRTSLFCHMDTTGHLETYHKNHGLDKRKNEKSWVQCSDCDMIFKDRTSFVLHAEYYHSTPYIVQGVVASDHGVHVMNIRNKNNLRPVVVEQEDTLSAFDDSNGSRLEVTISDDEECDENEDIIERYTEEASANTCSTNSAVENGDGNIKIETDEINHKEIVENGKLENVSSVENGGNVGNFNLPVLEAITEISKPVINYWKIYDGSADKLELEPCVVVDDIGHVLDRLRGTVGSHCVLCGKPGDRSKTSSCKLDTYHVCHYCADAAETITEASKLKGIFVAPQPKEPLYRGPLTCSVCLHEFRLKSQLINHFKRHTGEKFDCCICGDHFFSVETMQQHFMTHKDPSQSRSDAHNQLKAVRQKRTSGVNQCPLCPLVFRNPKDVSSHATLYHKGKLPFTCSMCEKGFWYVANLKKHMMLIHNTEKPFKCEYCGKSFKLKQILSRHVQGVHSEVYVAKKQNILQPVFMATSFG